MTGINRAIHFQNNYDTLKFETRMDIIDHLPCFHVKNRLTPEARKLYKETLDELRKKGIPLTIPYNCENFIKDFDYPDLRTSTTFADCFVLKDYGVMLHTLQSISAVKHPIMREAIKHMENLLSMASDDLYHLEETIKGLNNVAKMLNTEEERDGFREIMDFAFMDFLPYKLHGYGLSNMVDEENAYETQYSEMLIIMFMQSIQKMRGLALADTKHRLKSIAAIIYLFMNYIMPHGFMQSDMYCFASYIDKMLNYGVGEHVTNLAFEMQSRPSAFFDAIKNFDTRDDFINYAIRNKEKDIEKMVGHNHALDQVWNQALIMGNGYFSDDKFNDETLDELCYQAMQINPNFVSEYVDVNPSDVTFTIPENNLAYIRKETDCDMCKLYRRNVKNGSPNLISMIYLKPNDEVFVLFNVSNSKDTYGISLGNDNKQRHILKVGADNPKAVYSLVDGGELNAPDYT